MRTRNLQLNLGFMYRHHQSTDASSLPTLLIRDLPHRRLPPSSLFSISREQARTRNPFWRTLRPLLPHIDQRNNPQLPDYGARTVFNRIGSKSPLPSLKVAEMHQTGLLALLTGRASGVAKRIPLMPYGRHRPLITVGGRIPRGWMRALVSWVLGNVARHQPCEACGAELSRQHALECSGVAVALAARFPDSDPARHPHLLPSSILDVLIHSLTFRDNVAEQVRVQACVEAVDEIRRVCLGFQPFKDLDYSTAQEEFLSISHSIRRGAPLLDETERELRTAIALDYEPRALWILPPPDSVEL
ncbi:hypothetical protein HDU96_007189 [Phlyctochytrium bullatum]|nr:hypothetical protein HDU96_007189 [Phlyctochytrium bullatum]